MRKAAIAVSLAALAGSIVATLPRESSAQNVNPIAPTGKGIVGCGLLGGEAVVMVEAAAGVHARWTYAVFPLLGAAGGAVGGYFLEQGSTSANLPVASLVLGLGLLIPTTIAFVSATSFRPETDAQTDDATPSTAPLEESAPSTVTPTGGVSATPGPATPHASVSHPPSANPSATAGAVGLLPGLFNYGSEGLSLSVPAVSIANAYTVAEMVQYGQAPVTEVHIPVLSGSF